MNVQEQVDLLREQLSRFADPVKAESMTAYMKGKFNYMGVQKPVRNLIVKPWLNALGILNREQLEEITLFLWEQDEREFQYVAMELLFKSKKSWTEESLLLFEQLILSKPWWDTVDYIASTLVGHYFKRFPETMRSKAKEWTKSENLWLRRTAIIFQLKYREKTNTELLTYAILPHLGSREFFLQKAIGWALRQYSGTDPEFVISFVEQHDLKPFSKREALRKLSRYSDERNA